MALRMELGPREGGGGGGIGASLSLGALCN